MAMRKDKPCPFCGKEVIARRSACGLWWHVGCETKGCRGYVAKSPCYDSEKEGLAEWNTRHDDWKPFKYYPGDRGLPCLHGEVPEIGQRVLVSTKGMRVFVDEREKAGMFVSGMAVPELTAWKELPEGYEGEAEFVKKIMEAGDR